MTSSSNQKTESEKSIDHPVKKIVIRRLPPSLTKEQFLDIVSPLPEYEYLYYCNGDLSLGTNGFSRAYICFKNHQDVFNFRDRFDNYVFVDSKSNEYPALVEYAPYQRRFKLDPKNPPKKDSKCNTIEEDPDYVKYLENFGKPTGDQLPSCEAILEELEQKEKENFGPFSAPKVMTPLLEYLKKRREDKRSGKDRDRDRGDRGNRRRDRDDDKRYTGSGYGNKRRDDYYYGSGYKTKDYESSGKNQSTKSSTQPKLTLAPKSDYKQESAPKPLIISNQGTLNKAEQEKSSNIPKSSQPTKDNNDRSSTIGSQNKSGYGYKNSGNYNSSNKNTSNRSKNFDEKPNKDKNSTSVKQQQNNEQKQNKEEKSKDQNDKGVRNKDRPSIQIYNPGQRSNIRQQKN